ncbi:hypothetical protein B0H19DRAFT_1374985 [Mycena capillaripes]|nr:hypothetical protein B0H19DRAFT_1244600 [Mycena capillaripes]KAJ6564825.1 hypothetical protein B0H19DRAFT_1374985 [Mycena capillaripes]
MLAFVACRTREGTHHLDSLRDPMMRLPVKIVAEIFTLCLPDTYPGSSDQLPAKSRAPLLLLNICKHWADVAVSTPALWKNLVFHVRNYGVINEDGILEEVRGGQLVPGFDRKRYKQWYMVRFEDVLSRWLCRARGQGSLTLACGRLIRHFPGILGRNVHFLHKLTLELDDDRSPQMKELVQIFQSLDGPTTPSDLRVTVPGLISLVIANSTLARFLRFLKLPALQELHIASTAADLISLLATIVLGRGNPLSTVSALFPTSHTSRCGIPPYPNPCSARTSSSSLPTPNPTTSSQISSI